MPRAAPSPKLPGRAQAKKALQVKELWETVAAPAKAPVLVVNGELDRIRTNYYPPFWARKEMTQLREFVPKIDAAAGPLLPRIPAAAEVGGTGRAKKRAHGRGGFRVSMPSSVGGGLVRGAHSACGVTPFLALDTCVTQINFTG